MSMRDVECALLDVGHQNKLEASDTRIEKVFSAKKAKERYIQLRYKNTQITPKSELNYEI